MKNPIKNRLPYFFIAALLFCFTLNVNAQKITKPVTPEQTVKKNPDVVQKKKATKAKYKGKAMKTAKTNKEKTAKKDKVVHRPGTPNKNKGYAYNKKNKTAVKSQKVNPGKKANPGKKHAYGKNKGLATGKEFGKARSKTAAKHKPNLKINQAPATQ